MKMLMEIDSPDERSVGDDGDDDFPLPEGSLPSRRALPEPQIGSAKVPPRGGGVSSEKMAYDFFPIERVHIAEDGHRRATKRPTRQGVRQGGREHPPPSWAGCGPLVNFLRSVFFLYSENDIREVSGLFRAMQNRSLIFAPFPAQNPSYRHSPSLCKPCKIRENRHKYCDIMYHNSP